MNREFKIQLLNVLEYEDKKTGKIKTRIGYIYASKEFCSNTDKFIGRSENAYYVNGGLKNLFTLEDITTKTYTLVVGDKPSSTNLLRSRIVPIQLKIDNKVIIDFTSNDNNN